MRSIKLYSSKVSSFGLALVLAACGGNDVSDENVHDHADDSNTVSQSKSAKAGSGGSSASTKSEDKAEAGAGRSGGPAGSAAGSGGASGKDDVSVTIRFKGKVGSEDFACGREYEGQGSANTKVTPQDFRLFVQDLALIKADGTGVPVRLDTRAPWQSASVALLDFEDGTGNCGVGNPEKNSEITGKVPAGEYEGLSFVNGVPEDVNHKDPATQEDPLKSYRNLAWSWLAGYRFVKLELIQVVPSGQDFGIGLVHTGATACTGDPKQNAVTCTKPNRNKITLDSFDASSDTVVVDIGATFKTTNLTETSECHASGSACSATFGALGINFSNGKEKDGQTTFSVE